MSDRYRPFTDDNADGYAPSPSAYSAAPVSPPHSYGAPPSTSQPGQFGFNVPLQVGYGGYTQNVNVPISANVNQFGPGGQLVGQQLSMGTPGHLPKGSWSDGLFNCKDSLLIAIFVCFCPCIRFGISINRAFPDVGFLRPCTIWLILYILFGAMWWVGGAFIGGNWLWIPAVIIVFPIIGYTAYYRTKLREKYDIMGTIVTDYIIDWFCLWCAICQEARHIDRDHGIPV